MTPATISPTQWASLCQQDPDKIVRLVQLADSIERAEKSYREFYRQAWEVLEPGIKLIETWELHCMIDHAEAWARGECPWIIQSGPRGIGKSGPWSRFLQPWIWTWNQRDNQLSAGCDESLSVGFATDARRLIESEWYQLRWGAKTGKLWESKSVLLDPAQNAKLYYRNSRSGYRRVMAMSGPGRRADSGLLDDPQSDKTVSSVADNEASFRWVTSTFIPAINSHPDKPGRLAVVMQGLGKNDLVDRLIDLYRTDTGCKFDLCFIQQRKVIFDTATPRPKRGLTDTALTRRGIVHDPRTREGELLNPMRWSDEDVRIMERQPEIFAAQQQQMPIDPVGSGDRAWPSYSPAIIGNPRDMSTLDDVVSLLTVDEGVEDACFALLDAYYREPCPTCTGKRYAGYVECRQCNGRGCSMDDPAHRGFRVCPNCEGDGTLIWRWTLGEYQSAKGRNTTRDNAQGILAILERLGVTKRRADGTIAGDPSAINEWIIDNMLVKPGNADAQFVRTEADALRLMLPGLPQWTRPAKPSRRTAYKRGDELFRKGRWWVDAANCPIVNRTLQQWRHDSAHDGHDGISHCAATLAYSTTKIHSIGSTVQVT